jgi:site-specific DNA-cytosine methylase
MVSILDEEAKYEFPKPFPLQLRLKDVLEQEVDERYYLSTQAINGFNERAERNKQNGVGFGWQPTEGDCVAFAVKTSGAGRPDDNYVVEPFIGSFKSRNPDNPSERKKTNGMYQQRFEPNAKGLSNTITGVQKDNVVVEPRCKVVGNIYESQGQNGDVFDTEGLSPALRSGQGVKGNGIGSNNAPKVIEPIVFDDYNGRVREDQDTIGTITTTCGNNAPRNGFKIIEPQVLTPKRTEYGKQVRKQYEAGELQEQRKNLQQLEPREDGISNTLTSVQKDNMLLEPINTDADGCAACVTAGYYKYGSATLLGGNYGTSGTAVKESLEPFHTDQEGNALCISTRYAKESTKKLIGNDGAFAMTTVKVSSYRIRKLTERECFRLMDMSDEDINKIQAAGICRSQQYKMAGNSIVVACLYHIFRRLFIDTTPTELTLF